MPKRELVQGVDGRMVEVVVETPKGGHNKLKYDAERGAFRLTHASTRELADLAPALLEEIEAFFDQYNRLDGKQFRVLHRRGSRAAVEVASLAARRAP